MLTFKYRAISKDGANVTGVVEAFDEFEAVTKIKETCSVITKIEETTAGNAGSMDISLTKISDKLLAMVCSQFAIILRAGLPIVKAVELIANQTTDRTLRKLLYQVAGDVAAGFGLAHSFESKGSKLLPPTFIETVRSGEESGTMETAFERLHAYYDKSSKIKGKVAGAMVYPAFTVGVAIIVMIVIMVYAVPQFTSSFASMGVELPLPTRALIASSAFMTDYGLIVLIVLVALVVLYKIYAKTESGHLKTSRFWLRFPVLGRISQMNCASQFANTLSTTLAAGLPMLRAVAATARALDSYYISQQILRVLPELESGRPLGECLRKCEFLPDLLIEMTRVGEDTGSLESTLDVIGAYYDNETELASAKALSLLEPIIIVVLAVFVVFILLAVYAPIFSLYDNM